MTDKPLRDRVTLVSSDVLADDWATLTRHTVDYERRDGGHQRLTREIYERGDSVAVLPYDGDRRTILPTRQLRLPAFLRGDTEPMLEACAGALENESPESCALREACEELGYALHDLKRVCMAYSSPGSLTERLWGYTARYSPSDKVSGGGGARDEDEDIEVVEMSLDAAFDLIASGGIIDAKTILLIQHLRLIAG